MGLEEAKKLEEHYLMHTFARKDVMLVEGSGMEVKDDTGKTYLDFIGGIGADSLGHCHPAVSSAIAAQAESLIHVGNYYYIENRGETAKLISDLMNQCVPRFFRAPWKTFFCNSGAEANECAIKLARLYGKRVGLTGNTIITLDRSFHGRTLATLAATAQPAKQEAFQPLPDGFVHVPINDLGALQRAFLENPGSVCAVMVEPIQGEAGVYPCDEEYIFEAVKLARRNSALFICDEVQTGVYRCGENPFCFQNLGITPDIVTLAKGIASGFPMGACVVREELSDTFGPGDHGSTFGGSNLAMAAAYTTLLTLSKGHYGESVQEMGDYFTEKLATLPEITEVRGMGLMIGADLEESLHAPSVVDAGLEAGFLLNATGPSTLRFLPPLICTEKEINKLIAALPGIFEQSRILKEQADAAAAQKAEEEAKQLEETQERIAQDYDEETAKEFSKALLDSMNKSNE